MVNRFSWVSMGLLFSSLWASASVAGKFGLRSVQPLVLYDIRFFLAGVVMLGYTALMRERILPRRKEWTQLSIFGLLNTALYLGLFIFALQRITPGITTLALALNPLLISTFSAIWLKRRVTPREWTSLTVGFLGLALATLPLLHFQDSTISGLLLLTLSMITYSIGAVYYASVKWDLPRMAINAWQVLAGGVLLLPLTWIFYQPINIFDGTFWWATLWLVVPVSVGAVQLWLRLVKADSVKASLWLYLCPIFGFLYSVWLFDEKITWLTVVGTGLVLGALYLGMEKKSSRLAE
jgi:drug/metabolite transporter (DMT)-like permease